MVDNPFDLAERLDMVRHRFAMENYGQIDEKKYAMNRQLVNVIDQNLSQLFKIVK